MCSGKGWRGTHLALKEGARAVWRLIPSFRGKLNNDIWLEIRQHRKDHQGDSHSKNHSKVLQDEVEVRSTPFTGRSTNNPLPKLTV